MTDNAQSSQLRHTPRVASVVAVRWTAVGGAGVGPFATFVAFFLGGMSSRADCSTLGEGWSRVRSRSGEIVIWGNPKVMSGP